MLYLGKTKITPCALFKAMKPTADENTLVYIRNGSTENLSQFDYEIANNGVVKAPNKGKFGDSAFYFDGVTSNLLLPSLIKNNDIFTIDLWVKPTSLDPNTIWSHGGSNIESVAGGVLTLLSGAWVYYCSGFLINAGTSVVDQWYHVALIGDGINLKLYVNGNLIEQYSGGYDFRDYGERFGANDSAIGDETFNGYMDEIRISNIVRWSDNFTPPTKPYVEGV